MSRFMNEAVAQYNLCGHGSVSVVIYDHEGGVQEVAEFSQKHGHAVAALAARRFALARNKERGKGGWAGILPEKCKDCVVGPVAARRL